jgi:hypothetical protein
MRPSALCPHITPGIAEKIERHVVTLKIPKTKLQMAMPEVLGTVGKPDAGGGVSFIMMSRLMTFSRCLQ